jgi:hypothetical protein
VGSVDTQCSRDGCGPGGIKALSLRAALKKQPGKKCRDKNKRFCCREKSDRLIREYAKVSGRMIDDHHQKQEASQDIELNESLHLVKLQPSPPRNSVHSLCASLHTMVLKMTKLSDVARGAQFHQNGCHANPVCCPILPKQAFY